MAVEQGAVKTAEQQAKNNLVKAATHKGAMAAKLVASEGLVMVGAEVLHQQAQTLQKVCTKNLHPIIRKRCVDQLTNKFGHLKSTLVLLLTVNAVQLEESSGMVPTAVAVEEATKPEMLGFVSEVLSRDQGPYLRLLDSWADPIASGIAKSHPHQSSSKWNFAFLLVATIYQQVRGAIELGGVVDWVKDQIEKKLEIVKQER